MKELLDILRAYRPGEQFALATIVQTTGSSYRKAGAHLLIDSIGQTTGCISAGCLEADVAANAVETIKDRQPRLLTYDTTSDRDIVFGMGVGCQGIIEIFVEPLESAGILEFVGEVYHRNRSGAVATVVKLTGETPLTLGEQAFIHTGSIPESLLSHYAALGLEANRTELVCHKFPSGAAWIFVEVFQPRRHLVILGAGPDAVPVTRLAAELGWRTTVIDRRAERLTRDRWPNVQELIVADPEIDDCQNLFEHGTAVVLMTHNYLTDGAWLRQLLPLHLSYLGVMGPRKRFEKLITELSNHGFKPLADDLASVHNPIGLDLGANTPELIALSIISEIQATFAGRDGRMLKQHQLEFSCLASA